ncbi:MAG: NAD(P)/FAD-dependent oxidoreductase [Sphingomonas sp.]
MTIRDFDCLVVGGGPAGLTAAIYLSRFHLSVLVIDEGNSRAAMIPRTHNHAGYPGGIAGTDLIARMREQALHHRTLIESGVVETLRQDGDGFLADTADFTVRARSMLLATGVINIRPTMPDDLHDEALARGLLRYCPVCDGYEVTDQPVGIIGTGERGIREARFLRSYTANLTLIAPEGPHELSDAQRADMADAGIAIADGPPRLSISGDLMRVDTPEHAFEFASVYPALGSTMRSELAQQLGAASTEEGCLRVDSHQRTSVAGLYAAGDVVLGLDQISHAMGEGGVAATTMRNDLAAIRPLRR